MSDLLQRSCAHWSDAKRGEMEDFYALATGDYRHLAEAIDWRAWLDAERRRVGARPLKLLDVACGSGKFPTALLRHAGLSAEDPPIDYALLDPSAFSIREARSALRPPFVPGAAFEIPLQQLEGAEGAFDIAWAVHALYALPADELDEGLSRFLRAIADGVGVIAHACADAHYIRFHKLYLDAFHSGRGAPFTAAEDVLAALDRLGAAVEAQDLAYDTAAPEAARDQVEGFLQRCVFDDTVRMADLLARDPTGAYLAERVDASGWRFPQRVKLLFVRA